MGSLRAQWALDITKRNAMNSTFKLWAMTACLALGACANAPMEPVAKPSLYQRLGGMGAIEAVSSNLIDKTSSDPRTMRSFKGTDLPKLKKEVALMLCQASGGPCAYKGDSMKDVHQGMAITSEEFRLMAGFADQTMKDLGVGAQERSEVMSVLGPMKLDIVEKP
jgi:hemoglobin